ncbi:Uncharacterised protein [BD1-7 clade bacterium]|uniref:HTH luxR-type domain-containing protein n=1 Tax=BD1-7 clade bacterium TaxID=2029982 RepID=A0A5S9QI31_9GAMM|nr:Uncharacterised protein [BD1-7 clade bacterium]CAA0117725.1 Uncharacterised protein [BD1-7 clade bacterium]
MKNLRNPDTLSYYIDAIYQSVLEPRLIVQVLDELANEISAPQGSIQIENEFTHELGAVHALNYHDDAFESYAGYYIARDPWTSAFSRPENRHTFLPSHKIITDREYLKTEFYSDWGQSNGVRHAMGTVFEVDTGQVLKITFQRNDRQQAFEDEVQQFVNLLRPHFAHFVNLSPVFEDQKQLRDSWVQTLNSVNRPVWVVDRNLGVHFMNAAADQLASESLSLTQSGKSLSCSLHEDQQALAQATAAVFSGMETVSRLGTDACFERVALATLNLWVIPLAQSGDPLAIVMGPANVPDVSKIAEAYGLTDRQAQFCVMLYDGDTLQEIAFALNISVNTARNHLYECFERLGVKNQSELILQIFGGLRLY